VNAPLPYVESDNLANDAMVGGVHIRVFNDLRTVRTKWLSLEQHHACTFYQSYAWCDTWLRNVGIKRGIVPVVIVGENLFGDAVFILPLQLRTKLGVRFIEALTAPQGAYAAPLVHSDFAACAWFGAYFDNLVQTLPSYHVLKLFDIPATILGLANPLLATRHFSSANHSHVVNLIKDYDVLYASKRSSDTRRRLKRRDNKLHAHAPIHFGLPASDRETFEILRTMFDHQESRMAGQGIHGIFASDERKFILALAAQNDGNGPILRPYRLTVNGQIESVMLGGHFRNIFWGLISSIAPTEVQRFSPGDYTLRSLIRLLCVEGIQQVDFSVGDTPYKLHWADEPVPLSFIVRSAHPFGLSCGCLTGKDKTRRQTNPTPQFISNQSQALSRGHSVKQLLCCCQLCIINLYQIDVFVSFCLQRVCSGLRVLLSKRWG
jgi:CelD/BcsL family acetyltransferase involved in cellulose biosynthesis